MKLFFFGVPIDKTQRIRINVGDAGTELGTSAPKVVRFSYNKILMSIDKFVLSSAF